MDVNCSKCTFDENSYQLHEFNQMHIHTNIQDSFFLISERIFTCGNKEFGILFVNKAKLILNKMQTISTLLILR